MSQSWLLFPTPVPELGQVPSLPKSVSIMLLSMLTWSDPEDKGWLQGNCQDTLDEGKGLSLEGRGAG